MTASRSPLQKKKAARHAPERRRTAFQPGNRDNGKPWSISRKSGYRFSERKCDQPLDRFLQFLRGAERDLLAGLDLDRLAGRRVAAHARGALAHLQDAEAADADAVALLEVLDDQVDHVVEDQLGGLLGELMLFGKVRRDVLQGEGRGRCFRYHGRLSPCSRRVV